MKYEVEVKLHKDFIDVCGDKISIGLSSKPVKGEANRELIRKLAKHFKISTSRIIIVSGSKSKNKIVEIT